MVKGTFWERGVLKPGAHNEKGILTRRNFGSHFDTSIVINTNDDNWRYRIFQNCTHYVARSNLN